MMVLFWRGGEDEERRQEGGGLLKEGRQYRLWAE